MAAKMIPTTCHQNWGTRRPQPHKRGGVGFTTGSSAASTVQTRPSGLYSILTVPLTSAARVMLQKPGAKTFFCRRSGRRTAGLGPSHRQSSSGRRGRDLPCDVDQASCARQAAVLGGIGREAHAAQARGRPRVASAAKRAGLRRESVRHTAAAFQQRSSVQLGAPPAFPRQYVMSLRQRRQPSRDRLPRCTVGCLSAKGLVHDGVHDRECVLDAMVQLVDQELALRLTSLPLLRALLDGRGCVDERVAQLARVQPEGEDIGTTGRPAPKAAARPAKPSVAAVKVVPNR